MTAARWTRPGTRGRVACTRGVGTMAEMARAEALVRAMEADTAFQSAVQAAPTVGAKRAALDAHGFRDVSVEDMRAYVEGKGGKLVVPETGRELSDAELAAVAGGLTDEEVGIVTGTVAGAVIGTSVAAAAAA